MKIQLYEMNDEELAEVEAQEREVKERAEDITNEEERARRRKLLASGIY